MKYCVIASFFLTALLLPFAQLNAADIGETPHFNSKIQKLKKRAEKLHMQLATLEKDLLFPASSQIAVYVSMDTVLLDLDSIEMKINGTRVSNYLYSNEQVTALSEGALQQLYLDNVAPGIIEVEMLINGLNSGRNKDSGPKFYKKISKRFHKGNTALTLDLIVNVVATNVVTKLIQR